MQACSGHLVFFKALFKGGGIFIIVNFSGLDLEIGK
jgi:hypothetical protein